MPEVLDSLFHLLKPQFGCSRKRVHRLVKAAGIASHRKRAYKSTTNSKHSFSIAPNLLKRDFTAPRPCAIWVGDITYVPTDEGWLYAAIVKDLFTKKVVGYAFSNRIDTALTVSALEMAVHRERSEPGLIFHSDRGIQYAAGDYRDVLKHYDIQFLNYGFLNSLLYCFSFFVSPWL
ncbi:MAG: IS3 family transposase [Ethanoligenens sp.]